MKQIELRAKIENIDTLNEFITQAFYDYGFDHKKVMCVQLAAEEIFVNITKYGKPKNGKVNIALKHYHNPERTKITFKDSGIRFNPLNVKDPDVTQKAEDRPIGGLGIYLTKKLVDQARYRFENNHNVLVLEKLK